MTTEEIIQSIVLLEKEIAKLKLQVNEIDERTKQFKPWTQTGHPDFDLGE